MNDDGSEVFNSTRVVDTPRGSMLIAKLTIGDYAALRDESLQYARREKIRTYTRNVDLLPEHMRQEAISNAFKEASEMSFSDLGSRRVDVLVDGEMVERDVDYAIYWVSSTVDGMTYAAWRSLRIEQPQLTLDDVREMYRGKEGEIERVANAVGQLSEPVLAKNGDAPSSTGQRRRRRRR
jgi:hypothetical protein